MTTILPQARTSADAIFEQLGHGLSQTLPQAAMQRSQRETGLSAIDELQGQLRNANGDISKILPALARAYTLNPNLERSGIGQFALEQARKGQATDPVLDAIGGGGQQGQMNPAMGGMNGMAANAATQAAKPMQQQDQVPSAQTQGKGIFLNDFIPQDIGELISPEKEAEMVAAVAKRNGDVALTRQMIKDYNKGKIGINELANANVEKEAANVQRMLGFEDQIRGKIDKYLPKNEKGEDLVSESEKNIYYNMVRPELESGKHKTFSEAWQQIEADVDNFRKNKEAYVSNIPDVPSFQGISPEGEKQLRNSAQPILKIDPLAYNMLEQAYLQKGHPIVTPAKILKPLPQNVNSILSKADDVRDLVYGPSLGSGDFSERLMERNIEIANNKQAQQIPKIAGDLRKVWNEDLSLINIYTDLRRKGWSLPNINNVLDDVSDLFGKRQEAERSMLNKNIPIPTRYLSE